jgi:RimJ/RimL family protein N-acetyltransferase
VKHLIAHCDAENIASYKVMEHLGMHLTSRSFGRKNKSSDEDREELMYEMQLVE